MARDRGKVRTLVPAIDQVIVRAERTRAINRLAVVACALERYCLKHGAFPHQFADLAPTFLPMPAATGFENSA